MRPLSILVAGGMGFIGSNLGPHLRARFPDAYIMCLDNLSTGVVRGEWYNEFLRCNVEAAGLYLGRRTFDRIYHLASPASPAKYQAKPLQTIWANVWGTRELLSHIRGDGTFFFASSSEVYGDPVVSPQPESYKGQVSTTGPRACYDESKRMCETILTEYGKWRYGVTVKIARLFNVYGPGTLPDDGRAVSNFIWQAINGRDLTIYGDGQQTRAFTYVDDVVPAIVRLVEDTPADFQGPINIGTNIETSVIGLASMVLYIAHSWGRVTSGIALCPPAEEDPQQRLPDLALARKMLGWDPLALTTLSAGLARTFEYFESEFLWVGLQNSQQNSQ